MRQSKTNLFMIVICIFIGCQKLSAQEVLPKIGGQIGITSKSAEESGPNLAKEIGYTGDVSFPMSLAVVGAVEIQLQYNSNVHKMIRADNQTSPSGWVGLGWSLQLGSIIGEVNNTTDPIDDHYCYMDANGSSDIVQIDSGKFMFKQYKAWKITRQDSAGMILGWQIITEDGTIKRFGNYNKSYNNNGGFSLTNSTKATRHMLGYNGLVQNIDPSLYQNSGVLLIPYQWDLSDVQEVNWKHTTIVYQQVQEQLKLGTESTLKSYSRESHPWKIQDNAGKEAEFVLGDMDTTEYYGDSTSYFQYSFEKKYLDRLELKQNGGVYKKLVMKYDPQDKLGIGVIKRYLSKIMMFDRKNKPMPLCKYEYWEAAGANPGAMKQVTFQNGKKVFYHYKAQPLLTELDFIDAVDSRDKKNWPGNFAAGNEFCYSRQYYSPYAICYIKGATGWHKDLSGYVSTGEWPNFSGDYITWEGDQSRRVHVIKKTKAGWKEYFPSEILTQIGETVGSRLKVIGTGPDYFVIAYNPQNWYGLPNVWADYKVAVVRFTENGLSFRILDRRYHGFEPVVAYDGNVELHKEYLHATCANNYFVLASIKDSSNFKIYFNYTHYEYKNNKWSVLFDTLNSSNEIPSDERSQPYCISIGNTFVACSFGGRYGCNSEIIYQRTGDTLITKYSNVDCGESVYPVNAIATDHFCVFNNDGWHFDIQTWDGTKFIGKTNEDFFGPLWYSGLFKSTVFVSNNRLIAAYYPLGGATISLGYATYYPAKGEWSEGDSLIDERSRISYTGGVGAEATALNQNTFASQWIDCSINNFFALRAYHFMGNSLYSTLLDSIYFRLVTNDIRTTWQPGENSISFRLVREPAGVDIDTIRLYTMGTDASGKIVFKGNPWDYVLDTMKVISGMGDTLNTTYNFEYGVLDEQCNYAKYNKVTVFPPGNNGKTVVYYYNDLNGTDNIHAEEFIPAKHYEELDGIPYRVKVYKQDGTLIDSTINYYSAVAVTDTTLEIFYQQLDSTETTFDGVTTKKIFKYNTINLQPSTMIEKVGGDVNSDKVTEITYVFQQPQYSAMWNSHMYTQIYEEITSTIDRRNQDVQVQVNVGEMTPLKIDSIERKQFTNPVNQVISYRAEVWSNDECTGPLHFYIGTSLGGSDIANCTSYRDSSFYAVQGQTYYIEAYATPYREDGQFFYTNHASGTINYKLTNTPESEIVKKTQTTYRTSAPYLPDSIKTWDGTQWITTSRIISRDGNGNVKEAENVDGIWTTTKWGYSNNVPIATIVNASDAETRVVVCDAFGTSEYGGLLANCLFEIADDGSTIYTQETRGYNDWCQKVNVPAGLDGSGVYTYIQSPDQTIDYIIEFDFLIEQASLEVLTSGANIVIQAKYNVNAYKKQWQHAKIRWNLQNNAGNKIVNFIAYWNGTPSESAIFYLDNIRIYPVDAMCTSQTYDPWTLDVISTTDENGVTRYVTKDSFGRQTAVIK